MFNAVIAEHQQKQTTLREDNVRLRKAATKSVNKVTEEMIRTLNLDVSEAFRCQKQIEVESRRLQAEADRFNRQTQQWMTSAQTLDKSLREIGDFENWIKTMEWDMQTVASALENVVASQLSVVEPVVASK
mmetsp:Transcript_11771/g.15942  ORF Transcript_11771/g.15942 Transcript_11771/m.15942 type:complete len:131 (-) Transcript_11771:123-515(-)